jgi:hypothetical protein
LKKNQISVLQLLPGLLPVLSWNLVILWGFWNTLTWWVSQKSNTHPPHW